MVHVGNGYFMYKELFEKLYDHQKEAVLWMWGLHKKRKGGILGDDMGYICFGFIYIENIF